MTTHQITTTRRRSFHGPTVVRFTFLGLMAVFAAFPLLWGLVTSLKVNAEIVSIPPTWIPDALTLEHYRNVLFDTKMTDFLWHSALVAALTSVLAVVIGLAGGYAAARVTFRGRNALLLAILASSMVPGIAILVPLYKVGVNVGLHNTFFYLVLVYTAWQMPTVLWMMRGFIRNVSVDLEESAMVEGCSRLGAFLRITVPALRPGLAAALLIVFVFVWNDWLVAMTLISTEDKMLAQVGLYRFIGDYGVRWGDFMAYVMIATLPIVAVFLALSRLIVSGLTAGATKG